MLKQGFDQLFLIMGWSCNSFLQIFLALPLHLDDFEEELLGMRTHLRSCAGLYYILNKLPVFSMERDC